MNSSKKHVQQLTDQLIAHGIEDVIVSPGSRNAPLVIDFEGSGKLNCINIMDERGAAYVALGMTQKTGKPTAIVCTSGSAAANYLPAVTEAYYQRLPLIVITADRPEAWIGQGDGQTIQQSGLFGKHVSYSADLSENEDETSVWFNSRRLNEALINAHGNCAGPVHINVPLTEPLYDTVPGRFDTPPIIKRVSGNRKLSDSESQRYSSALASAKKVLILAGMLPEGVQESLSKLAELPQVLLLTESTSNIKVDKLGCIDRLITGFSEADKTSFSPDILITLGHSVISKRIKILLRTHKPQAHWHIDPCDHVLDTFTSLTDQIVMDPNEFFGSLDLETNSSSDYSNRWKLLDAAHMQKSASFMESCPYSDLWSIKTTLDHLPQNSILQMGNSSIVRYIQLFNSREDITYFGNRGVSGIDGCTSTAVGSALKTEGIVTLISGETAFQYDSNALRNANLPSNLKMIVLNNGGGGIFRIIDGPSKSEYLEKHFESKHNFTCEHIAQGAGVFYTSAQDMESVQSGIKEVYSHKGAAILEIFTPGEHNPQVLESFFNALT